MTENTAEPLAEVKKVRTILVPYDGSEHSKRALSWCGSFHKDGDLIILLHVVQPEYVMSPIGMALQAIELPDMRQVLNEDISQGKKMCQEAMQKVKAMGFQAAAFIHVDSNAGHAVIDAIGEHKIDFVVIGNRGLGTIRRTILGSVSNYVIHHSPVPVIIVPHT